MHEINELFASNAVPFAFDESGQLVATGSVTVSALALQPALDVLEDSRLADARRHLLDAQRRLNENRPDKAVDDARFAVEYAMLAVLDATNTPRPEKHQPDDLFDALAPPRDEQAWVVSRTARELVLGATRLRGRTNAGHAGLRELTPGEAEAAIASAAAAVLLLADYLPGD
jgi:HEPN domain-containing protein